MSLTREEVIRYLEGLSAAELAALLRDFQERVGLPEALRAPDPFPRITGGVSLPYDPDQRSVRLLDVGPDRIAVLHIVRSVRPIGLDEARRLVASAPVVLLEEVLTEQAREVARRLSDAGARVELV